MAEQYTRRTLVASMAAAFAAPVFGRSIATPAKRLLLTGPELRPIEIFEWRPKGRPRGIIVFSHGALSAPWKYERLLLPWAQAGYRIFAPLHVDSTDHHDTKNYPGLASWRARIEDMRVLSNHIGNTRYVAAGHSYGGLVALTLGGAAAVRPERLDGPLSDGKALVSLAFSPPGPAPGLISAEGYGALAVPALIQTGTQDVPPGAGADAWRSHFVAYEAAAPGGSRYGLVLDGVDHYFGGAICRPELRGPPQLAELALATEISLLFCAAYAGRDRIALERLTRRIGKSGPAALQVR